MGSIIWLIRAFIKLNFLGFDCSIVLPLLYPLFSASFLKADPTHSYSAEGRLFCFILWECMAKVLTVIVVDWKSLSSNFVPRLE